MKTLMKKQLVVLGFVFFFALFLPKNSISAYAKDISKDTTKTTSKDAETDVPAETPAQIKLNVKTKALVKDVEYTLKVYNLSETQKATFKSSDTEVATVDENGVILGLSKGTAVITVTVKEGAKTITTLTCDITVGPPAISIKWTKTDIVLLVGKKTTLKTIILPYNTTESAKFLSANPEIATVSSTGKITAKSTGITYVFTTIDNGKYDFCKITVVDEETYRKIFEEANIAEEDEQSTEPEDSESEGKLVP